MNDFSLNQANKLNNFMNSIISDKGDNEYDVSPNQITNIYFEEESLFDFCNNDEDEALFFKDLLLNERYNGIPILKHVSYVGCSLYYLTSVTEDFFNEGGFVKIYEENLNEKTFNSDKKNSELEYLKLGSKQYKFNKVSVIINIIFTFITIVLTILIALGVFGKK